jgi:hypothetical protein
VDRTSPGLFSDKSKTVSDELARVKGGLLRTGGFSSMFDDYFEHNLQTISSINLILPLAS